MNYSPYLIRNTAVINRNHVLMPHYLAINLSPVLYMSRYLNPSSM